VRPACGAIAVELAAGAEDNGLASMLSTLVRQNLEANPRKRAGFGRLAGRVAIVAEDVDVALTLHFHAGGRLIIHDGIDGVPDVTIRGPSEVILALSNLPSTTPLGLPIARRGDAEGKLAVRTVAGALRRGELRVYGAALHLPLFLGVGTVLSVQA
jgi:hypothetical protein